MNENGVHPFYEYDTEAQKRVKSILTYQDAVFTIGIINCAAFIAILSSG